MEKHTSDPEKFAGLEKPSGVVETSSNDSIDKEAVYTSPAPIHIPTKFQQWNNRVESLAGLEARGIVRVTEEERHGISPLRYAQMAILWFAANVTANNLAVGLLGPLLFGLGFVDSVLMAVFGCLVGSAVTAYMSIWGAQSGNRTMASISHFL